MFSFSIVKRGVATLVTLTFLGVTVASFQNCSQKNFNTELSSEELLSQSAKHCSLDPDDPSCADLLANSNTRCMFNGRVVAEGETITAFQNSNVAANGRCISETRKCQSGSLTGSFNFASCAPGMPKACLFNGQTIDNGKSVTAYQTSSVPYGTPCKKEERVCSDGVLGGSFMYAACTPGSAAACLFNGQTIASGQSVTAYLTSTVPFGQTCSKESRLCSNGRLSGQYNYASCTPGAAMACQFNGQTVAHGQTVVAYQNSTVAFGSACVSENRTCNNGSLSGAYVYASCMSNQPRACLFEGRTIAHGDSVLAYASSSVPYNQACISQTRTCVDGILSGNYPAGSCKPASAMNCSFNGMTVINGQDVIAYLASSVAYPTDCSSVRITRHCDNGTLQGDPAAIYGSCQMGAPRACMLGGQTIPHGSSIRAFLQSSVPFGAACAEQTRYCNNGMLDGSYTELSCAPQLPANCSISLAYPGEGGEYFITLPLAHGSSVTGYLAFDYYQASRGAPGDCNSIAQARSCYNGSISGGADYNKAFCTYHVWENPGSPLMVHMNSNTEVIESLLFTSQRFGINFDILGKNSSPVPYALRRISWYKSEQYFFLTLPTEKGEVTGIDQMFGDNTIGPDEKFAENGYLALAKYDGKSVDGKKSMTAADGYITKDDPIFEKLRLWNDRNYDGKAQSEELVSLSAMDIEVIDLNADPDFLETDIYGNQTTLKSVVKTKDGKLHLMFDIWFRHLPIDSFEQKQPGLPESK